MEEKKRTIVMFGDSLTDYFPMEKLKDIDAQFINSGVAVRKNPETVNEILPMIEELKEAFAQADKQVRMGHTG